VAVVLLVHVLIGYALVSGTARQGLNLINKPLEVVLIQEVSIPPPPPPPPPPKIVKPRQQTAPKALAPLPYVPPPDEPMVSSVPTPVIAAVVQPPPAPAVIQPPAPAAPTPSPAPAAKPARSDMAIACPTQVAPEMPRRALRDGTQGVVKAQALISHGVVKEVVILSGPAVFHSAVRAAMLQYKCTQDSGEVLAVQEFNFRIE